MLNLKTLTATALGLSLIASVAAAQTTIRVQSVIPAQADEVFMLNEFANDVRELTDGEVIIEVLPAGAVVGVQETLDAVDSGLIEGGFAWSLMFGLRIQCFLFKHNLMGVPSSSFSLLNKQT